MKINKFQRHVGYVRITKQELINELGKPMFYRHCNKTFEFWEIEFFTGEILKIYGYNFNTKEWRVGSNHDAAMEKLQLLFPNHFITNNIIKA
jgi:hypothetical protein